MDLFDKWLKKFNVILVNRSYGQYTSDTVSKEALLELMDMKVPKCTCGKPFNLGIVHRDNGEPCYHPNDKEELPGGIKC